jgi:rsbT co-antagonist protein RsbR
MSANVKSKIAGVLEADEAELLKAWVASLEAGGSGGGGDLRNACAEFLAKLREASRLERFDDALGHEWSDLRDLLAGLSRARALQGFTATETATFVFSIKKPLFDRLRLAHGGDAEALADDFWRASTLLDRLGLWTTEVQQQAREDVIARQGQEMLELSTPVVKLWEGILALPMIGTLDSQRAQVVMESLLEKIVETGSQVAIIDITGVPMVDTLVAQHLIKTITAARLMGADCIVSGIRPQIAQTIVHLGVDLAGVTTKSTLADALALAMRRSGLEVVRSPKRG